jgi:hypothetical protein
MNLPEGCAYLSASSTPIYAVIPILERRINLKNLITNKPQSGTPLELYDEIHQDVNEYVDYFYNVSILVLNINAIYNTVVFIEMEECVNCVFRLIQDEKFSEKMVDTLLRKYGEEGVQEWNRFRNEMNGNEEDESIRKTNLFGRPSLVISKSIS